MDFKAIKNQANQILLHGAEECSYIEYKASPLQKAKILKTICAFGNNYYDNDVQFIFLGVEEINDQVNKAIPKIPICGIKKGELERCRNEINALKPYLYPKILFDVISNRFQNVDYLLIVVRRQTGGPFMVNEKAEKEKTIRLKAGRYIRVESETRLARVDEEYDLLRKFAGFHYSSLTNTKAGIDDLDLDLMREYIVATSHRKIMMKMDKEQIARALHLVDKNDPSEEGVKNFAVLMFCKHPEDFIPYAYTEIIVDMFGNKRKMESKYLKGPIWKQYDACIKYINDNYLNTIVIREDGKSENRKVSNFTYVALEELVANALVHNNYENAKSIQIYISETQINIVNYNKPLPPLRIQDLNERYCFNERDTENPEIRDMFKELGIIESFGTGIGEAKRSLEENGSPALFYKTFDTLSNVTSVVIPVNEEYIRIKSESKPKRKVGIQSETQDIKRKILDSAFSVVTKNRLLLLYAKIGGEVFGNSQIVKLLNCSETTATTYIKKMFYELEIISAVEGKGKGKYRFKNEL